MSEPRISSFPRVLCVDRNITLAGDTKCKILDITRCVGVDIGIDPDRALAMIDLVKRGFGAVIAGVDCRGIEIVHRALSVGIGSAGLIVRKTTDVDSQQVDKRVLIIEDIYDPQVREGIRKVLCMARLIE